MRYLYYFFSVFIMLSAAGCAKNDLYNKNPSHNSMELLLNYYKIINSMDKSELKVEYSEKERIYYSGNDISEKFKYIFLMIFPESEFYNSHKAGYLLNEMIKDNNGDISSYNDLAILLRDVISIAKNKDFLYEITKKRLDEIIAQKQNQDILYKEVHEKLNMLMEEYEKKDVLNKQIKEELDVKKKTVEELQKKIDEIKVIEKSINDRKSTKEPTT